MPKKEKKIKESGDAEKNGIRVVEYPGKKNYYAPVRRHQREMKKWIKESLKSPGAQRIIE